MKIDYSIQYSNWHDTSPEHADSMAANLWKQYGKWAPTALNEPILDIGCGYGFFLRALQNAGYVDVLGLELSEQQAIVARQHGHAVEVTDDTVRWLETTGKSYALITMLDVLEHIEPSLQLRLLEASRSALKPGGRLLIQVPNANAILASRWLHDDWTHYTSFTEHSLAFVLKCSGFADVFIETEKGLGRLPKRIWRRSGWIALRKWLIRWAWLQVHKAEIPWENIDDISFELNLVAVARA